MDSSSENNTTPPSGLYQTNFRGMTLKECWRLSNIWTFPIALVLKLVGKKANLIWLPTYESEKSCLFDELSPHVKEIMKPKVKTAQDLGYQEGVFKKLVKSFDPSFCDGGFYIALHHDRKRILSIGYTSQYFQDTLTQVNKTIAHASYFIDRMNTVTVLNYNSYLDSNKSSHRLSRLIYLYEASLDILAGRIERELQNNSHSVLSFAGINHLLETINRLEDKIWLDRLKRGLIRKIPSEEENKIINASNEIQFFLKDINTTKT